MSRALPEWIGASDDAKVPPRVRARIFLAHGGRCYLSGRAIRAGEPWQLDHIKALCNGGEHRELNLAPVLTEPHREKTRADVDERVKTDRVRAKFIGTWPKSKAKIQSRGFQSSRPTLSCLRPTGGEG